jgi:enoyl-CoA hydratase
MAADHILVERSGAVLRVTLNRPEKRNALSRPLLADLGGVFRDHAGDESLCVAVLRGQGDQTFAAGGDLRDLSTVRTFDEAVEMAEDAKAALAAVRNFPVPVAAGLNGDALGGGAELALACDFRVAAAHARIGFIQGRLNISTAWGGGVDLVKRLGPGLGLRLMARAELLGPEAAREIGLIDDAAHEGESLDAAIERFIAPMVRQSPLVLRAFKAVARAQADGASRAELDEIETRRFAATWVHDDHWEAAAKVLAPRRRA